MDFYREKGRFAVFGQREDTRPSPTDNALWKIHCLVVTRTDKSPFI